MKKLILFLLLLSGVAYGQSNNTTNTKFTNGLAVPNGATQKPTSGLTAGALSYVTGAGLYVYNGSSWELLGLSSGSVTSFNSRTGIVVPEIGDYSSFYVPLTRSLTINGATQTLAADRTWTVTANTTNSLTNGYGLTGGVFDGSVARTWVADTVSVSGLVSKLRLATNLTGYVKKATTITINGVTQDLSDNRIWTAGTVTSVGATAGTGISVTGSPITSSGNITITNTAPDQTVTLTGGTGISTSGTYPNFTITNTSPSPSGLQDSLTKKANRTFDNVASGAIANVKLANSTISGVSLGSNLNTLTLGNGLIGTSYNGSSAVTARVDTTQIQTVANFFPKGDTRYLKLTDTAISAHTLANTRTIWGQSFDGSANVSGALSGVTGITTTGGYTQSGTSANTFTGSTNANETFITLPSGQYGPVLSIGSSAGAYYYRMGNDASANFNIYDNDGTTVRFKIASSTGAAFIPNLGGGGDRVVFTLNTGQLVPVELGSGLSLSGGILSATGGTAGTINGSGSTGSITKFTGSGSVGNSILVESGSTVTTSGYIGATSGFYGNSINSYLIPINNGWENQSNSSSNSFYRLKTNDGTIRGGVGANSSGIVGLLNSSDNYVLYSDMLGNSTAYGTMTATGFYGAGTGLTGTASGLNIGGNAATATSLQTARTISGVSFDGTANITLNNNAITNGAGYITASSSNTLTNKSGNISQWTNDVGYAIGSFAGYAPLNSPAFTGTPSLPTGTTGVTQTQGDNSNKLATTAYVDALGGTILGAQKQIVTTYTNISTSGTSEQSLFNHNIAQSNLSSDGDRIDFNFAGSFGLNANDKYVRISVGGNLIPISGNASNKSVWEFEGYLMRTSSTTYRIFIKSGVDYVYSSTVLDRTVTDFNPLNFQILGQTNSASFPVTVQIGYLQARKAP